MRAKTFGLALLSAALLNATTPVLRIDNNLGLPPGSASGAPYTFGPVSALATCHTNGVASTTIQWPGHGLSGLIPTDRTAILFLGTASGRQYTEITAVPDGNTLTVEDSFNIAAGSPVNCAVGGPLNNASTQLVTDMKGNHGGHGASSAGGWELQFVSTGVAYTWTAARTSSSATPGCGFYGIKDGAGLRPTITCTFQPGTCLTLGNCDFARLELTNSNATKTGTLGLLAGNWSMIYDAILGGANSTQAWETAVQQNGTSRTNILGSLIRNNTTGVTTNGADRAPFFAANVFQSNGIGLKVAGSDTPVIFANVFWSNTKGVQITRTSFGYTALLFNTLHSNTTAVEITDPGGLNSLVFASNLLTNNSTGVSYTAAARDIVRESALVDFNCYGQGGSANGSDLSGFIYGSNVIFVNPAYVDAGNGDFRPTNGVATFIAWPPGLAGLSPRSFPGSTTPSKPRCGALQPTIGGFGQVGQ